MTKIKNRFVCSKSRQTQAEVQFNSTLGFVKEGGSCTTPAGSAPIQVHSGSETRPMESDWLNRCSCY